MSFLRRNWPWLVLAIILSAVHLTSASGELGGHLGGDNITYLLLGKAIANGDGYVDLYLPGNPVHRKYPFLFPLMLAPFHLLFDHPLLAMHVMICLFWAASFVLFGLFVERRLSDRRAALALAFLAGIIPRLYAQGTHLLSEAPYIAFCFGALALAEPRRNAKGGTVAPARDWPRLAGLIALALCAYFTRTAALALGGALVLSLWREKPQPRLGRVPGWLAFGAAFAVGFLAWWLFANSDRGFAYFGEFLASDPYNISAGKLSAPSLFMRVLRNVFYYLPILGMFSIPPLMVFAAAQSLVVAGGGLGCAAVFAGLGREVRRRLGAAEWYFIFGLLITLAWPFQEDRFILPLVPLGLFYFFSLADWAAGRLGPRGRLRALAVTYVIVLLPALIMTSKSIAIRMQPDLHPRASVRVKGYGVWNTPIVNWSKYDWNYEHGGAEEREILDSMVNYMIVNYALSSITPVNAVILSRKPMITYYLSGRKSVPIVAESDPDFQWEYIQGNQVDYFVAGVGEDDLMDLFQRAPERFRLVADIDTVATVFKVMKREQPLPP